MYKNMMDSMKKPVTMESKMAKKSAPKAGLKGNQSKLDANKNGKWDTGDYQLKKQPEQLWQHESTIQAKPSWEYIIDFKPFTN